MNICVQHNSWFTNVGEAFIDLGLRNIVKTIAKEDNRISLSATSPMSFFYLPEEAKKRAIKNELYFEPDLLLMGGMYASSEFYCCRSAYNTYGYAEKLREKNKQIAFIGFGGEHYDEEERENVLRALDNLKPLFIITRDSLTFELYKDYFECKRGLDCAFWVNEDYNPVGVANRDYIISTFNRSDEPIEVSQIEEAIHPWHMQFSLNSNRTKYLSKDNLFVSDSPYEYLTLYANAKEVYTDLVHATIPSLVYNTPVKYYEYDKRRDAFEHIPYITKSREGFLKIDQDQLNCEKKLLEDYIKGKIATML